MWTSLHIQWLQNVTSDKDHEELFKEASNSSAYLSLDSRVLARFVTVDYEEHEQFKFGYYVSFSHDQLQNTHKTITTTFLPLHNEGHNAQINPSPDTLGESSARLDFQTKSHSHCMQLWQK